MKTVDLLSFDKFNCSKRLCLKLKFMVDLFLEKLQQAILDKSPFALLRKPNEKLVRLIVNDGSELNSIVFHSFDSTIEKEISDANPLFIDQHRFNFDFEIDLEQSPSNEALSQSEYEEIIQETINTIQAQAIRKVVMSRRKVVDNQSYNLLKSYKNLMDQHATALVFLWMNPSKEVRSEERRVGKECGSRSTPQKQREK